MCCLFELTGLILGIIVLVRGEIPLGSRAVSGGPARVAGLLLMVPGPLSVFVGIVVGLGMQARGEVLRTPRWAPMVESGIFLAFTGLALCVALIFSQPIRVRRRRRKRRDDDYDEDDYPRHRRRRYEEEDEDDEPSPRRRRRSYAEEDEPPDEHVRGRPR